MPTTTKKKKLRSVPKTHRRSGPISKTEFDAMSPAKKRMAVARDVIAQVKARNYIAEQGEYFRIDTTMCHDRVATKTETDIQKLLVKHRASCHLCGVGAAMASYARIKDRASIWSDARRVASRVFNEDQLVLIETAFEGKSICGRMPKRERESDFYAALLFYQRHLDPDTRLRKIYENVVKNKSTFVP